MNNHEKINYIELPAYDLEKAKTFFNKAFAWTFVDYGPEYISFVGAGIDGGFYKSELKSTTKNGSVLVVLYSTSLQQTQAKIEKYGGIIIKPIFSFPGGRRFHFSDPNGNEFAVWSE